MVSVGSPILIIARPPSYKTVVVPCWMLYYQSKKCSEPLLFHQSTLDWYNSRCDILFSKLGSLTYFQLKQVIWLYHLLVSQHTMWVVWSCWKINSMTQSDHFGEYVETGFSNSYPTIWVKYHSKSWGIPQGNSFNYLWEIHTSSHSPISSQKSH